MHPINELLITLITLMLWTYWWYIWHSNTFNADIKILLKVIWMPEEIIHDWCCICLSRILILIVNLPIEFTHFVTVLLDIVFLQCSLLMIFTGKTFLCNILPSSDGSSRHTFSRIWNEESWKRQSRYTVHDKSGIRAAMHATVCNFASRTQITVVFIESDFLLTECFVTAIHDCE